MDAVRNDRRDASGSTFEDPALATPASVAAAQKTLAASEPWRDITQYLPDSKTTYSAQFFANRAFLAGAAPLPSNPLPPAVTAPLSPLQPSADAVHGILLAADSPTLPPTTRADISRSRYAGDYRLHPQVQVDGTGTAHVAYWSAYNTKEQRTDFYVGPDNLDTFQNHPSTFAEIAARVPVGGLEDWEVESGRTVDSLLAGQPGQAAEHFGRSWGDAVTNTRFIEKTIENTVLSLAGATALGEIEAAQELEGEARFSRLGPTSVQVADGGVRLHGYQPNPGGVVRSVDEAREVASAHGVDLPDWMVVRSDPGVSLNKNFATYRLGSKEPPVLWKTVTWEDVAPDGVVVVRVHPSVFESDEAIVGVLAHESHELTSLRAMIEQDGQLTWQKINDEIRPTEDNLHGQAWDVADARVLGMRGQTPEVRALYQARARALQVGFDAKNDIQR